MKNHFGIILRTWGILKPFHKDFYFQLVFLFLIQGINLLITFIISKLIDALIGKDVTMVIYILIAFPLFQILGVVANYIRDVHYTRNLFQSVIQFLQELSFGKILSLNISQYTEDHSAIKKEIIDRGESALKDVIEQLVLNVSPIVVSVFLSLFVISWYAPIIGLWCFVTLVILIVWTNLFNKYFKPFIKQDRDNWIGQVRIKTEAFQHLHLIRQTGVEEPYLKKYLNKRFDILKYSVDTWLKNSRHSSSRNVYIYVSRYISLLAAVYFFSKGDLTVGAIYAIFSWTGDLYSNVGNLSGVFRNIPTRVLDIEKYFEASIDKKPVFKESGKEKYKHGIITFENVSFKYPKGEHNVLDNVSFSLLENKKTAFVGHSGSGKSTIIKLLLRAYDYDNGSIKIGDKEIRDLNAVELRRNIGYVEQHVDLLDDTLKENILLGVTKKKISDKKLEEIAKRARIDQFYHRLGEKKFETFVGERGIKLSGGERQRVGIARAIIKDPDILIFDEATSSLDTENEAKVMEAIDDVSQGKTTIVVAHRLSTVRNADMIIVMDKGKVVGQGTHDDLLESCAEYRNLVEHQV